MIVLLERVVYLCSDFLLLSAMYWLFGICFDRSNVNRYLEYAAYGMYGVINSLGNIFIGGPTVNLLISSFFLLCLTLIYPGTAIGKTIRALGVVCLMILCEMAVFALLMLCRVPTESFTLIGTLLSHLLMFLVARGLKQIYTAKSEPQIPLLQQLAILCLPIGSLILMLGISVNYFVIGGEVILLNFFVLSVINLLTFYVLDRLNVYHTACYERELLQQQNRAYQAEFDLMRQSEQQTRALRHDMKNHLAVLREYAHQGRMDELEQYLNTFGQKLNRPEIVCTGNSDIDSILNYKLGYIKQLGAKIELDIKLPEDFTADAFDLNVILGNLLDNAAEGLTESSDRWMSLSLHVDRGVFFLRIANSYDGVLVTTHTPEGVRYRSRKKKIGHGLGLEIVRRTVEQYDGRLQIASTGTIFTVEAILYLNQ